MYFPRGDNLPKDVWQRRQKSMLWLTLLHLPVMLLMSVSHHTIFYPEILVGFAGFVVLVGVSSIQHFSRNVRSTATSLALLLSSFILIHSTNMLEMHFHIFLVLTAISLYHMWKPMIASLIAITAHHYLSALFWPVDVFGTTENAIVLASVHLAFIAGLVSLSLVRWKIAEKLRHQYEQVSTALDNTTGLAEREHIRADVAEHTQGLFVGAMVHELKTPLTIIRGYGETMIKHWERLEDYKKRDYVERMIAGTVTLDQTIENDLKIIRHDAEGWKSECILIPNINQQVESIVNNMTVKFPLEFWESEVTSAVSADARVLQIILEHLIENAHTHGFKDRPIVVTVLEHRRSVEISITSWGTTVDRLRLTNECFNRGSRGKASSGSGLGLWIVKNYARSMGSEVSVNQVDRGGERKTTFSLSLPKTTEVLTLDEINEIVVPDPVSFPSSTTTTETTIERELA